MLKAELHRVIGEIVEGLGSSAAFTVDYPPKDAALSADYATNAALAAAQDLKKPPREVADLIAERLRKAELPMVKDITIAGPGFINITLATQFFADTVARVLSDGEGWGYSVAREGDRVVVEYTSPNLFKPLHVGNLMANIVGESVCRLVSAHGAKVLRVNYVSNIGLTVAKGVWGLKKSGSDGSNIDVLGEAYLAGSMAYEKDPQAKEEIDAINRTLYAGNDKELNALWEKGSTTSFSHLMELCRMLGTEEFDLTLRESESGPVGRDIVREHVADGIFEESDGAIVFRGEKYGLHTRVFINSAGLPTYEAKDVGVAKLKQDAMPFDQSIVVTGAEQREYFKVVHKAIEEVFPALRQKLMHIPNGFLTLPSGKKMSSRKGGVLTGESVLEELVSRVAEKSSGRDLGDNRSTHEQIATAAIKYVILKQGLGKNVVFDMEQSLSFEGDSGPYLQYAYVRTASILRKAKGEGVAPDAHGPREMPGELERLLTRYPEVVERAAGEYEPHHVAQYLTELSSAFNSWYASTKVLDGTDKAPYKLAVVEATGQTLKNGLYLLGIEAPEQM